MNSQLFTLKFTNYFKMTMSLSISKIYFQDQIQKQNSTSFISRFCLENISHLKSDFSIPHTLHTPHFQTHIPNASSILRLLTCLALVQASFSDNFGKVPLIAIHATAGLGKSAFIDDFLKRMIAQNYGVPLENIHKNLTHFIPICVTFNHNSEFDP